MSKVLITTVPFGDERCVPPDHDESNYGMAMQTLFSHGVPIECSVFRMEADAIDIEAAEQRYADLLPDSIDVILLGVGEDGHIASLFPTILRFKSVNGELFSSQAPSRPSSA